MFHQWLDKWIGKVAIAVVCLFLSLGSFPAAKAATGLTSCLMGLRVVGVVPFAWLRSDPNSHAPVVTTVYPSYSRSLIIEERPCTLASAWDGIQTWWHVKVVAFGTPGAVGWVEEASIDVTNDHPDFTDSYDPNGSQPVNWPGIFNAKLRAGVRFAWVRAYPSSVQNWVYTLRPNQIFSVQSLSARPKWDKLSKQWWWYIVVSTRAGKVAGWIEQASIMPL